MGSPALPWLFPALPRYRGATHRLSSVQGAGTTGNTLINTFSQAHLFHAAWWVAYTKLGELCVSVTGFRKSQCSVAAL